MVIAITVENRVIANLNVLSLQKNSKERFEEYITRVEVHLKDENGKKEGVNDKTCVLEARLKGKQPIAVTSQADSIEKAVSEAIDKMKAAITTVIGKSQTH